MASSVSFTLAVNPWQRESGRHGMRAVNGWLDNIFQPAAATDLSDGNEWIILRTSSNFARPSSFLFYRKRRK
jgi:hypothetical protein